MELFSVGVEEEYLLVDIESGALVRDPGENFLRHCRAELGEYVDVEVMRSQLEIKTHVHTEHEALYNELIELRLQLAEVGQAFGIVPLAASTHPLATWRNQLVTPQDRYEKFMQDYQRCERRTLVTGMHVHVGIEDCELRLQLMNQMSFFIPHLLALSTSSPFWHGEDTGLASYRTNVWDALPRTGLPERFTSYAEFENYTETLKKAGIIENNNHIWWGLRLNSVHPTLELRSLDVCTRLDHAMAIVALYRSLARRLFRDLQQGNAHWDYPLALISENYWRAQRYGCQDGFFDIEQQKIVSFSTVLDQLIEWVREDAKFLGCEQDLLRTKDIVMHGTSADWQRRWYQQALHQGATPEQACAQVAQQLITQTLQFASAA